MAMPNFGIHGQTCSSDFGSGCKLHNRSSNREVRQLKYDAAMSSDNIFGHLMGRLAHGCGVLTVWRAPTTQTAAELEAIASSHGWTPEPVLRNCRLRRLSVARPSDDFQTADLRLGETRKGYRTRNRGTQTTVIVAAEMVR